jgi:hypothetical protein
VPWRREGGEDGGVEVVVLGEAIHVDVDEVAADDEGVADDGFDARAFRKH